MCADNSIIDASLSPKKQLDALQMQFARLQRSLLDTDKSLLILIDGWESSGKGQLMRHLVKELDPRYYEVRAIGAPNSEESKNVLLWRFWKQIPKYGRITILTRSWYTELLNAPRLAKKDTARQLEAFEQLEQTLKNDNMLVIKFFIRQSKSEMKKNIRLLNEDKHRRFMVTERDLYQLDEYELHEKHFASILEKNAIHGYPWTVLASAGKKPDSLKALKTIVRDLERLLRQATPDDTVRLPRPDAKRPVSLLDLGKSVTKAEYDEKLDSLQAEAGALLYEMYTKQKSAVVVFEGTDAAGKGGAIRRLVADMDPRGFDIATTAAPDATERQYHYLWRFMRDMPADGMLTIFDRSWYGRVLVERVEQFTPVRRWSQSYEEVVAFEHHLVDQGRLVLKFLIVIDKEEQKKRFEAREADPDKSYKLTDEDWRNHEKFDQYNEAMDDMVERTSTDDAPWIVVAGTDKRYARLEVLRQFIAYARAWLKEKH